MKAIKVILVFISVLALTSSCIFRVDTNRIMNELMKGTKLKASRVYVTKDTTVSPFSQLNISNSVSVSFVQDPTKNSVSIFASDNVMPYVWVSSEDGCLEISLDPEGKVYPFVDWGEISVVVYAPALNGISVAGSSLFSCTHLELSGDFQASVAGSGDVVFGTLVANATSLNVSGSGSIEIETFNAGDVNVQVAGSGDIDLKNVDAKSISANVAGSGEVDLAGRADRAVFYVVGSGEVDAEKFRAKETQCSVSGSGSVTYQDADGRVKKANK